MLVTDYAGGLLSLYVTNAQGVPRRDKAWDQLCTLARYVGKLPIKYD